MWKGRDDTGNNSHRLPAGRPDRVVQGSIPCDVSACDSRLRRLTGLLAFQENRSLHFLRPA